MFSMSWRIVPRFYLNAVVPLIVGGGATSSSSRQGLISCRANNFAATVLLQSAAFELFLRSGSPISTRSRALFVR
jgi:hypothetical protein